MERAPVDPDMNILVLNCGSSSMSFKVFASDMTKRLNPVMSGKAHRVGVKGNAPSFIEYHLRGTRETIETPLDNHRRAAMLVLNYIRQHGLKIDRIGHRFVHGGNIFPRSAIVNAGTYRKLHLCLPLAPIHNPVSLSVVDECLLQFPDVSQYVTFDTAFHSSIPHYASVYPLPKALVDKYGFRKYGFHGLSYSYVTGEVSHYLRTPLENLNMVVCHLGTGGSSVAAIRSGKSVDTSMGYSPLTGLVMSTRCGDIDPMLAIYFMSVHGFRSDDLLDILNKKSGLLGVSGFSSDLRDIIQGMGESDSNEANLAFKMYVHRLKRFVGSYLASLGETHVLAFTDDIGIESALVREKICENLEWCGIVLDQERNQGVTSTDISVISSEKSKVDVLCVPTNEELQICKEGMELTQGREQ
jgi:acetate kinase